MPCRAKNCGCFNIAEKILSNCQITFNQDAWKNINCLENLEMLTLLI